jgi:peptidoglycan/xylan/chitin deacetylase (PgdA/CDA1 family)
MNGTPILMYHGFADGDEPGSRYILPARRFEAQLRMLRRLRFRVISFGEHVARLREGALSRRTAVITIDDGYLDNLEIAYPILRHFDVPATLFMVSGRIGGVNDWDTKGELAGRRLLGGDELRKIAAGGIEIGAHTRSHPNLPVLDAVQVGAEIAGSKADLEAELESRVDLFAYPYGRHDEQAVSAVRRAGFYAACTTRPGLSSLGCDPFLIERIEVRGDDSMSRFVAGLLGWAKSRS